VDLDVIEETLEQTEGSKALGDTMKDKLISRLNVLTMASNTKGDSGTINSDGSGPGNF